MKTQNTANMNKNWELNLSTSSGFSLELELARGVSDVVPTKQRGDDMEYRSLTGALRKEKQQLATEAAMSNERSEQPA